MSTQAPVSGEASYLAMRGHLHAIELAIDALAIAAGVKPEAIAAIRDVHQEHALLAFAQPAEDERFQAFYAGLVERLDSVLTTLQSPTRQ